jgi:hypothetical protein
MGPGEVTRLVLDIEERSAEGGFATVPRPSSGFASSTAFDSGGSIAAEVHRAYTAAEGLMYGPAVPLAACLASVHTWSELI